LIGHYPVFLLQNGVASPPADGLPSVPSPGSITGMSQGFATPPGKYFAGEQVSLRSSTARASANEMGILIASGALAALAMALVHMNLRLPGHAILKPLLPIMLGLAFVPRRFGGCIAGLGAAATAGLLLMGGWGEIHASAMTSLVLLGPALDVAAGGVHSRAVLIARCAAAGLFANLAALGVKLVAAPLGWESGGGRGFAALWPFGILTFVGFGLLAGALSAAISLAILRRGEWTNRP
jgi:hypothetical protein